MTISGNKKSAYWLNHLAKWRKSGLSQAKYCAKENISAQNFSWWKTRGLKDKLKDEVTTFVPAIIKAAASCVASSKNDFHLILPNQSKLVLPADLPLNDLVIIIKSLGGLL